MQPGKGLTTIIYLSYLRHCTAAGTAWLCFPSNNSLRPIIFVSSIIAVCRSFKSFFLQTQNHVLHNHTQEIVCLDEKLNVVYVLCLENLTPVHLMILLHKEVYINK